MARELGRTDVGFTREPITATASELNALKEIEQLLTKSSGVPSTQDGPIFIGTDEDKIELPRSVFLLLHQNLPHLRKGHALTVLPLHKELTTQEAADLLNVSRPFLIGLLERGEIPYVTTGKHRRIRFGDVVEYKTVRDATRRQALHHLTELGQEYGLDRYGD